MIKLIMTWNIRDGQEAEYLEFLTRRFAKILVEMGLQPTDAWYAAWGHGPQVIAGGVTNDLASMEQAMNGEHWETLKRELGGLVTDLEFKVVEAKGGFQF
jgi:hypothetical protein